MGTVTKTQDSPRKPDEGEKVASWKLELFKDMGYEAKKAEDLANWGVDHHLVQELLNRGCSHELAAEIAA